MINPQAAAQLQQLLPAAQMTGSLVSSGLSGNMTPFLYDMGSMMMDALNQGFQNSGLQQSLTANFSAQTNFMPNAPGAQQPTFMQALQNDIQQLDDFMDQKSQTWQVLSDKLGL